MREHSGGTEKKEAAQYAEQGRALGGDGSAPRCLGTCGRLPQAP